MTAPSRHDGGVAAGPLWWRRTARAHAAGLGHEFWVDAPEVDLPLPGEGLPETR